MWGVLVERGVLCRLTQRSLSLPLSRSLARASSSPRVSGLAYANSMHLQLSVQRCPLTLTVQTSK
mgnify:CR=1 FL=1